jgi:predicted ArsR family transcriptional regulator
LLDELQTRLGKQETRDILNAIAAKRLEQAPKQDLSLSLEKRLKHTAAYLTEQGYIASWGKEKGNWFIRICNCLYQNVSSHHPELCSIDLFVLEQISGEKLARVQSMTDGSHACVYQVVRPERD